MLAEATTRVSIPIASPCPMNPESVTTGFIYTHHPALRRQFESLLGLGHLLLQGLQVSRSDYFLPDPILVAEARPPLRATQFQRPLQHSLNSAIVLFEELAIVVTSLYFGFKSEGDR